MFLVIEVQKLVEIEKNILKKLEKRMEKNGELFLAFKKECTILFRSFFEFVRKKNFLIYLHLIDQKHSFFKIMFLAGLGIRSFQKNATFFATIFRKEYVVLCVLYILLTLIGYALGFLVYLLLKTILHHNTLS